MTIGSFVAFIFALVQGLRTHQAHRQHLSAFPAGAGNLHAGFCLPRSARRRHGSAGRQGAAAVFEVRRIRRASFAYDSGPLILNNIDLKVPAGAVVAIVGSSGAGKTTLVNLLPRFYAATSGAVRIDGYDVRDVTLRSLREQMAIVTQETILFNDTIWNNLCYGRPDMPEEKVIAAAQAAMAHDFIMQMPQGYQTLIGDRGQRLSGGQRQRLAIARALLKDAPILILDEATSELDSESEMLVQSALNNLMTGRTVFVIAHRLSTIRRADMIAVLEDGAIRERGTHEELLARGGIYARLYEMQFRDAEPASARGRSRMNVRSATHNPHHPIRPRRRRRQAAAPEVHDRLRPGARRRKRLEPARFRPQRESSLSRFASARAGRLRAARAAHPPDRPRTRSPRASGCHFALRTRGPRGRRRQSGSRGGLSASRQCASRKQFWHSSRAGSRLDSALARRDRRSRRFARRRNRAPGSGRGALPRGSARQARPHARAGSRVAARRKCPAASQHRRASLQESKCSPNAPGRLSRAAWKRA